MTRRTLIVVIALAAGAAYPAWLGYGRYLRPFHGYEPIAFSSEAWRSADSETRGHMVEDLRTAHLVIGMTIESVEALLGPPDFEHGPTPLEPHLYIYRLGWMGANPHALVGSPSKSALCLDFDGQGLIKRIEVYDGA